MNNKLFFIGCCAYLLSMGNAYADEKGNIGSVPLTIGSESVLKSDTTRYEELAAKEDAHSKYLKAMAKKNLIQEKMDNKDYIGALDPTGDLNKKDGKVDSFSPVPGMKETMVFDNGQVPNLGHAPQGFYNENPEPVMSKEEIKAQKIEKDMPMISNVSMVNGVIYIGVMQDGVQFVAEINEKLRSGYVIKKVNSVFATIKQPSGDLIKVYIGTDRSEDNSSGSTGGSSNGSSNVSAASSSQASDPNVNMNIDGTPTLGAAGLPM